ncbi:Alpha/Beta hydrolase protein [Biscogniauxia mediterranea]|nr:Alpha/Beta hydrolase protein [Biscogniauxia mediterranea]
MPPHIVIDPGAANAAAAAADQDPDAPSSPRHWLMGTEAFERRMPHHASLRALWETKWEGPCRKAVYPFHDGAYEDFAPIFADLIAQGVDDGDDPRYTRAFLATAEALEARGDDAAAATGKNGDSSSSSSTSSAAGELYLRAAAVLRIARFPYVSGFPDVSCPVKWDAWERQKRVYAKAGRTFREPLEEVSIPHVSARGRDRAVIPAYVRVPASSGGGNKKCPAVLLLTGLDGYRPDNTTRCNEFLARGWAAVVVEIPGTADCPADPADPASPDRLWDSVFAWLRADGRFDRHSVVCWGLSSGGYYAVRAAHTHRADLRGAVAQGAGCHYFYDRGWLERADGHEYPFRLAPAMARKHGFASVEEYKEGVQRKFSLLELGILDLPCTRLLLVNGTLDGLMPIEDSMMLFNYGTPKEARFFPGALHMGYPMANASVYPWMEEVMSSPQQIVS